MTSPAEGWQKTFPSLGQTFATYDDFAVELHKFEVETQQLYTVCRSVSVTAGNKALKSDKAPRFKEHWQ